MRESVRETLQAGKGRGSLRAAQDEGHASQVPARTHTYILSFVGDAVWTLSGGSLNSTPINPMQ